LNVWEHFIFILGAAAQICETTREKGEKMVGASWLTLLTFWRGLVRISAMALDVTTRSRF
jgi:hypothetical protein